MTPSLYDAIKNLADGRVFALIAPHLSAMPYIVHAPVAQDHVIGISGSHGLKRMRVQVDVWARTFQDATSLQEQVMDQVAKTLPSLSGINVNTTEFDPQSQTFRVSTDYTYYE